MSAQAKRSPLALYSQAAQCLENKQWQEVADLCKDILSQDEAYAPAYALMAELWRRQGTYANAEKFAALAVRFAPAETSYVLQHAQCLVGLERWEEALHSAQKVLQNDAHNALAHMLAGAAWMQKQDYPQALSHYNVARQQQDTPNINEQIGLCLIKMRHWQEAEDRFKSILKQQPDYAPAHLHLARLEIRMRNVEAAEYHYRKAIEFAPSPYKAFLGLGEIHQFRNENDEALNCFNNALQAAPRYYLTHFMLGHHLLMTHRLIEAEPVLRHALKLKPDFLPAQHSLAVTLLNLDRKQEAIHYVESVLSANPDNPSFRHILTSLQGKSAETAPAEYVRDLFDAYAAQFDNELLNRLEYRTPDLLAGALAETMQAGGDDRIDLSMLDLGCGTGLGAEAFKTITIRRDGVDLSTNMLAKAAEKKLYDHLSASDILQFLQSESGAPYDLIVAADVFVYLGNLRPVFTAAGARLADGGYFAFSVENGDDGEDYTLRPTGRFAHAAPYIESLASTQQMQIASCNRATIRMEAGKPISGYLYVLRK